MTRVEIEVSEENEGTESPWWMIIDPSQNMRLDVSAVAHQITGPFFSRETAQAHLTNRIYAFSDRARVYCHSGYWSEEYKNACRSANKNQKR